MEEWRVFARRGRKKRTKQGKLNSIIWEVSNLGRVRKTSTKTGKVTYVKQQLSGGNPGKRYPALPLNDFKYVHRLVALNFVPNPNPSNFTVVDHIDGDTQNNHWTNLRWVTPSENAKDLCVPITIKGVEYKSLQEAKLLSGLSRYRINQIRNSQ